MKLGMQLGYDDPIGSVAMAQEADRLGFDSVWTSEAWGADAVTVAAWIAATTERIGIGTVSPGASRSAARESTSPSYGRRCSGRPSSTTATTMTSPTPATTRPASESR